MKIAAIDIGSNGIRLSVAEKNVIINKIRIPLRLGTESFGPDQEFSQCSIEYTTQVFKCISTYLKNEGIDKYKIYATSAFRNAKNSAMLAKMIEKETKLKIEKIDGDVEANIVKKSVLNAIKLKPNKSYLLFDLGGGSIELSKIKDKEFIESKSFELGTVRLMNYMKSVDGDKKLVKKKIAETQTQISDFLDFDHEQIKNINIIGTGGNFRRLLKMSNFNSSSSKEFFTENDFFDIKRNLKNKTYLELIKNYDLRPDRADVIIPAIMLIEMIIDILPIKKIYAPQVGLIDGILSQMEE